MSEKRCHCGRKLDRPSPGCEAGHPSPSPAQATVEALEKDLTSRNGLSGVWEVISPDQRDVIRDHWAEIVGGG